MVRSISARAASSENSVSLLCMAVGASPAECCDSAPGLGDLARPASAPAFTALSSAAVWLPRSSPPAAVVQLLERWLRAAGSGSAPFNCTRLADLQMAGGGEAAGLAGGQGAGVEANVLTCSHAASTLQEGK